MNGSDKISKNLLALQLVDELSIKKKQTLINATGDLAELGRNKKRVFDALGDAYATEFFKKLERIDDEIEKLRRRDISYVSKFDDEYPERLAEIEDAPLVLFVQGDVAALKTRALAIVGTRRPTRYGTRVAEEFARDISMAGVTIISGFARGVDGTAHRACVEMKKPTVAVFACGLDICYPAEHRNLREDILANGGAIVSEYALGVRPAQYHFPERNRLISGLSEGVLLVEAAKKSGSLITMRLAIEQNRDIYIVPSNIYSTESEGSNALLKEMPHSLVISPQDILDDMGVKSEEKVEEQVELSIGETLVLEALHDGELHFEELLAKTGLNVGELTNLLFNLQLGGLVDDLGGNYYAKR